ncbi:MAG: hypothetical protein US83_C0003G0107 [Candidatus Falkowbacteria bacterium GW2011_GWC2_38_22]|uniref:Uncharacterized protein n=1 Tax=Candidatus Falkowbacteria bacterium GW2011_GWE1_38_31 TaxID=1618638 RepID=A0A0G0JXG0_9BACT|nr:MAG: hypothetical protein US73_C0001G0199 [Candidatus Falkowbacteria bacterium GW2011_GWF2_38_1205]KKQ61858.1 MAG: hypothetical protein US83_C0003G0107 [Candidatus Falkowbacteria bacterium GW2011_GWC2_38_22]KKQ64166.1 MAG: hypothetical protein US84_C0002G0198 [Candidatus Falkowbacteria bacterium GW2011_GWF1_38_22]KKQ66484.1 MAG: hypothetical protein US87_C0001G0005 [Candidatus Falkowbacteria bacterium GW2011_GWE2_38_254]KKQ71272.1 MAG: hypothetical protein US91_C0001G0199 [Candidatus Falkowb
MNILLINPPYFNVYKGYEKAAKIGAAYPPIGILYLASKLVSDGHNAKVLDAAVEYLSPENLIEKVIEFEPSLVGITATTPLFHVAAVIAKNIKKIKNIPIVIGGFHVTILREKALINHPEFDFACIGQGEYTLSELARAIENNIDPKSIQGLIINKNGEIIITSPRPRLENLDELPFPIRPSADKSPYLWAPPKKGVVPITSIMTQRGCPFQCVFCSQQSMYGNRVTYRDINKVLDELEYIVNELGYKHVIFLDDTLIIKREKMVQLCAGIKERNLEFTWEGMARANLVDEEIIKTMAKVGLNRISFGIESGDEETLIRIKKGVTTAQMRQAYKWAKEAGIETRGSAIIGHPGETSKSAWKTIEFLRSLKHLDQAYINIMVPYPGTPVFEMAKAGQAGYRLLSEDFENYVRYNDAVLEVNDLTVKKLKRLQNIGLWLFYLTPHRIYYNLRRAGLKNGFIMAFAMLKGLLSRSKKT